MIDCVIDNIQNEQAPTKGNDFEATLMYDFSTCLAVSNSVTPEVGLAKFQKLTNHAEKEKALQSTYEYSFCEYGSGNRYGDYIAINDISEDFIDKWSLCQLTEKQQEANPELIYKYLLDKQSRGEEKIAKEEIINPNAFKEWLDSELCYLPRCIKEELENIMEFQHEIDIKESEIENFNNCVNTDFNKDYDDFLFF